jgi:hypothetical protein
MTKMAMFRLLFAVFMAVGIDIVGKYCPAFGSPVLQKVYFVDSNGLKIRTVRVDFGVATSNIVELVSRSYYLKLIDDTKEGYERQVSVSGGSCRIGGDEVPASSLRILLNNKSSVSTSEAKAGVNLVLKIENSLARLGIVNCEGFDFILR